MPEANPENRLPSHQAANGIDRIGARFGIAWAIRKKYSVRFQGHYVFSQGLRWNHGHPASFTSQLTQNVLLNAEIVSHYVKSRWLVFYSHDCNWLVRALA